MKLKLDKNFSPALTEVFQSSGFDTHSVWSENLSGTSDEVIFSTIITEKRVLITFDTDFCNILRFPPESTQGIIVIRPNRPISLSSISSYANQLVELLQERNPKGCLWVLEPGKLRVRKPEDFDEF